METTVLFACLYGTPYGCHFCPVYAETGQEIDHLEPQIQKFYRNWGWIGFIFLYCLVSCPLQDVFLQTNPYLVSGKNFLISPVQAHFSFSEVSFLQTLPVPARRLQSPAAMVSVPVLLRPLKHRGTWRLFAVMILGKAVEAEPGEVVYAVLPSRLNKYSRMLIEHSAVR